ncbi:Sister chromatid cohesion protein 2 [Malassezia sp. CBS 17886]|nr:Sister chromatid cohesion protein 2 [Malassezia sp. CBS 17886]
MAERVAATSDAEVPASDDIEVLEDDLPARLRGTHAAGTPRKRRTAPDAAATPSKWPRHAPLPDTSDAFGANWADEWDLDDAQLYSEEPVLLTSDTPMSSPVLPPESRRTPTTPAQALVHLADALAAEADGDAADGPPLLARCMGDLVLTPTALRMLYALLRRCARETDKALAQGTPRTGTLVHLLDVDAARLAELLALVERTMRLLPPSFEGAPDWHDTLRASSLQLLCAQSALTVLAYAELPKFLFSEDIVCQCLTAVKAPLDALVLPLVDAVAGRQPPGSLAVLVDAAHARDTGESPPRGDDAAVARTPRHRTPSAAMLSAHFHQLCAVLLQLERLFRVPTVALSDALVIRSVYLALAPFFVLGRSAEEAAARADGAASVYAQPGTLRPVQLSSLHLLRVIFARYPLQRQWIIGEVLFSLLRFPDLRAHRRDFRLPSGRSVYVATAILLQLLQAAAHASPHEMQRADAKDTQDVSYADTVHALVADLITLLFLPDWPAASLLVSCLCAAFTATLQDTKAAPETKALALENLGMVAARLCTAQQELQSARVRWRALPSLGHICATQDTDALDALVDAYRGVAARLLHAHHDHASATASTFILESARSQLERGAGGGGDDAGDAGDRRDGGDSDGSDAGDAGDGRSGDDSDGRSGGDAGDAGDERTHHRLRTASPTARGGIDSNTFPQLVLQDPGFPALTSILGALVHSTRAAALGTRTHALRALALVGHTNPHLLDDDRIRAAVLAHVQDSAASVRDTAVGILGTYVLADAHAAARYRALLVERAMDTAVAVRRRVVRLLRSLYVRSAGHAAKVETALALVRAVHDTDPGVQTMACDALEALWFAAGDAGDTDEAAQVIAAVTAHVRERPSPLDALLQQAGRARGGQLFAARLGAIVDRLLRSVFDVDAADMARALQERIRVVRILAEAHPRVLNVARAKQLLPYVNGTPSAEEEETMEELLRLFALCVPHMPRTARAFADALERAITPIISRGSLPPGSSALQALVACFCTVIGTHTHNYALLHRALDACIAHLEKAAAARAAARVPLDRGTYAVMCIAALLCDAAPASHTLGAPVDNACAPDSARRADDVFARLLVFFRADDAASRLAALTAIGYILRARPSLFLEQGLAASMDAMLAHGTRDERRVLLHVLLDYLERDAQTRHVAPAENMLDELRGATSEYADAGTASALVQRFVDPVLRIAQDRAEPTHQRLAAEILKMAVLQGLSHPLQCLPCVVALETSTDVALRTRAVQLHRHLVAKHASLLASRWTECARAAYAYQRAGGDLFPSGVRGAECEALLQTWYALLRDQRTSRQAFLTALTRLLDVGGVAPGDAAAPEDVGIAIFIAENLSALEYKTADEPLLILHELRLLDAVAGVQVAGAAQRRLRAYERQRGPSPLTDEESDGAADEPHGMHASPSRARPVQARRGRRTAHGAGAVRLPQPEAPPDASWLALVRSIRIVRAGHALRAHLRHMYRLSEDKFEPGQRGAERPLSRRVFADPARGVLRLARDMPQTDADAIDEVQEFVDFVEDGEASESDESA